MKILLRSRKTKLYYAGENEWRAETDRALTFPSSLMAWHLAVAHSASEPLELVYLFNDRDEDYSCPIEPPSGNPETAMP